MVYFRNTIASFIFLIVASGCSQYEATTDQLESVASNTNNDDPPEIESDVDNTNGDDLIAGVDNATRPVQPLTSVNLPVNPIPNPYQRAADFNVSSSNELVSALITANAGDVIELAPGNYQAFSLSDINFASPVLLRSANSSNPASFVDSVSLTRVSNLYFSNIDFIGKPGTSSGQDRYVSVSSCDNILFQNGTLKPSGIDHEVGFYLNDSDSVTVDNMDLSNTAGNTVYILGNSSNISITRNKLHSSRSDAIKLSGRGGLQSIKILGNIMGRAVQSPGAHVDMIQIFNNDQPGSIDDLQIMNNVMVSDGGTNFQGIFMSNCASGDFTNVVIANNLVQGGHKRAISPACIDGGHIYKNTIVPPPAAEMSNEPRMTVGNIKNVIYENNVTAMDDWLFNTPDGSTLNSGNIAYAGVGFPDPQINNITIVNNGKLSSNQNKSAYFINAFVENTIADLNFTNWITLQWDYSSGLVPAGSGVDISLLGTIETP